MTVAPPPLEPAEFALRCAASQGGAAFLVYVVPPAGAVSAIQEVHEALEWSGVPAALVQPSSGAQLLAVLQAQAPTETVLVNAAGYGQNDWGLLDRRRSSLQRPGVTILVTTPTSFDVLMQNAPNLMSWFGGEVFTSPGPELSADTAHALTEARLAALRSSFGQADADVLAMAAARSLPRDPEYAEWLVLLGREDLLDA